MVSEVLERASDGVRHASRKSPSSNSPDASQLFSEWKYTNHDDQRRAFAMLRVKLRLGRLGLKNWEGELGPLSWFSKLHQLRG